MEKFLTIVAVVEGAIIGLLALLQMQRSKQVLEERAKKVRLKKENLRLRREMKERMNRERNEDMTDEEADRALDRLLGDDSSGNDGDS